MMTTAPDNDKKILFYVFGVFCFMLSIMCVVRGRIAHFLGSILAAVFLFFVGWIFLSPFLGSSGVDQHSFHISIADIWISIFIAVPIAVYVWRARFGFGTVTANRSEPTIRATATGFTIIETDTQLERVSIAWQDINRIETFKQDLFTTDCIYLAFHLRTTETPILVSEESTGFADLFTPMQTAFPSIPERWYFDVMHPAFKTNFTVLYNAKNPG